MDDGAARREITPHTFIGVSLALLGVVLTLDNLGFVEAQAVFRFWPLVPILFGPLYVVQGRETRDWILGTGWIVAGTAFLLRNLEVFRFRLWDFLPLMLVAIGLKFMFGRRPPARAPLAGDAGSVAATAPARRAAVVRADGRRRLRAAVRSRPFGGGQPGAGSGAAATARRRCTRRSCGRSRFF